MFFPRKVPSIFSYAQNGARFRPTASVYRGDASSGSSLWGQMHVAESGLPPFRSLDDEERALWLLRKPQIEEKKKQAMEHVDDTCNKDSDGDVPMKDDDATPRSAGEEVEGMEVDSDCCEEKMETDEENDDKDNILKGEMLGDRDIMRAQSLLKIQFPGIGGLLPPTLGPAGQFPPIANGFVQIINTMKSHWVCLSTLGCVDPGTINYYCSGNDINLTEGTMSQIAALHPSKYTEIHIKPVHPQSGVDCGVHAIAIAFSLCLGKDPSVLKFTSTEEIRRHLWSCFQNNQMSEFPHQVQPCNGNETTILLSVHCRCRMPYFLGDQEMAACDEYRELFHARCENIPNEVFQNKVVRWKCSKC